MFNTIDYIGEIVKSLTFTQPLSNYIYDTTSKTSTFDTCKTYWVTKDSMISIGGTDYKVSDFEINKSITVQGDIGSGAASFTIAAPNFFHGTPIQANIEFASLSNWRDKFPMCYFIEPYSQRVFPEKYHKIYNKSSFKILLMTVASEAIDVYDEYVTAIKPIDNLVFEFEKKLLLDPMIAQIEYYDKTNRVNYGVWVARNTKAKTKNQDNLKKLTDEDFSGIEIDIEIPFKRQVCDKFGC